MIFCIAYLDVTMFVHVFFLFPFNDRIALHLICGERLMMFQYYIYWIMCMSSELIPEILFNCNGCYFRMFVVHSYNAPCHCDLDCI